MADTKPAAVSAGLFILAAAAAAVVLIWFVTGGFGLVGSGRSFTVAFGPGSNLAGLQPGADVRVLGIAVGRVDTITVGPDAGGENTTAGVSATVRITLPERFDVRTDADVEAASSLTGTAWLNFANTGSGEKATADTPLDGRVQSLTGIIDQAEALIPKVERTVDAFTAAASNIETLAADANALTVEVRDTLQGARADLDAAIASARAVGGTLEERLPGTLDRADLLLDDADALVAQAGETFRSADASLQRLPAILDNIEPAVADARGLIADISRLVRSNRPRVAALLDDLSGAVASAEGAIGEIRAAPWRLLYKPKAKDQRNLALYSVARQYADAAQDLESAAALLNQAQDDPAQAPADLNTIESEVRAAYQRFDDVQDRLWNALER